MSNYMRKVLVCRLDSINLTTSLVVDLYEKEGWTREDLGEDIRGILQESGPLYYMLFQCWLDDLNELSERYLSDGMLSAVFEEAINLISEIETMLSLNIGQFQQLHLVFLSGSDGVFLEYQE